MPDPETDVIERLRGVIRTARPWNLSLAERTWLVEQLGLAAGQINGVRDERVELQGLYDKAVDDLFEAYIGAEQWHQILQHILDVERGVLTFGELAADAKAAIEAAAADAADLDEAAKKHKAKVR